MTNDADDPPIVGVDARAVLDALVRAVVVTDPDGHILLWNRSAEELYGWADHEVLGRSILDVLAPDDEFGANHQDLMTVADGKVMSGDRLVTRRDGQLLRVLTFTRPIRDESGKTVALVGASEDVGALRDAEQQARDLSEHFHSALEAGGLGTWRWNMKTGETVWDARLEGLFGLSPGEFDGTFDTYVSLLHPDDRQPLLDALTRAVESKSTYRVEHRAVWPDGSVHWIAGVGGVTLDESNEVTGTVGCSMDVTERMEQELERQRLADVAMSAATNERLLRERLEFLGIINDALNASSTVPEVMRNVTTMAVPRLGDWCSIHVLPGDGRSTPDIEVAHVDPAMVAYARELHDRFPYDPDAPAGVAAVIRTGVTEFYSEIDEEVLESLDVTDEARALLTELDLRSAISVAMKKRGRILGAIQFVSTSASGPYTHDDVALAETVAGRVAASIENRRLHEEQREIAATLQRSLLPEQLPVVPGIDTAVRYWANGAAAEVGGDFYDMFALEEAGHFAVVLGDVCGTGPAAAALTGLARHTIRDSAWHHDAPDAVLASLNRAVRRSASNTFLTCVYATIEPSGDGTRRLTIACGGHPLPTLVDARGAATLGSPGTLLGVLDEIDIHVTSVELGEGDVVVFHTDGATDVAPPYALDETAWRMLVHEAARSGESADTIAENIQRALEAVLPFESRNDDIALLVMAVRP